MHFLRVAKITSQIIKQMSNVHINNIFSHSDSYACLKLFYVNRIIGFKCIFTLENAISNISIFVI